MHGNSVDPYMHRINLSFCGNDTRGIPINIVHVLSPGPGRPRTGSLPCW